MFGDYDVDGVSASSLLSLYLKEIGRVPLLSNDCEKVLAEKMLEGDAAAKTAGTADHDGGFDIVHTDFLTGSSLDTMYSATKRAD